MLINWEDTDRDGAFEIIKLENDRLNDYSPVRNKQDTIKRLEDIALSLQQASFSDQQLNHSNWSTYQYDVHDLMNVIQYLKEKLPDEV